MTPRRTAQLPWTRAVAPLAAAAALACGVQDAAAENWPVYVTGTERVSHENNLFRREKDKESDNVSTTEVTVGIDKSYGRQNYNLALTGSMNRYQNNDQLNNNGFNATGAFSSTFGKDISASAAFSRARALASFDNGNTRITERNIRNSSSSAFNLRYGLYGALSIGGSASHFEQDYTLTSGYYPNQTSTSYGVDVRYTPRELLTFGVGLRHSPGKTAYTIDDSNHFDSKTETNNLDFSTDWRVTGLSAVSARLSYTKQERTPTAADTQLDKTDFKGWTGSLDWKYTPRGRLTYKLGLSRDTTNNASLYDREGDATRVDGSWRVLQNDEFGDSRVTTTVNAGVDWEASAKIRVSLDGSFAQLQTRNTRAQSYIDVPSGEPRTQYVDDKKTGRFVTLGLNASYAAARWLNFNCGVQQLHRTADVFNEGYNATVINCAASATLNAQN